MIVRILALAIVALAPLAQPLGAQSIEQELARRGLTFEQAQRLARQAGVDPNDPAQLADFARGNGVPESQIQDYLVQLRQRQGGSGEDAPAQNVQDLRSSSVTAADIQADEVVAEEAKPTETFAPQSGGLDYFGYNIFGDVPDPFKPSSVGPVDDGYVIGPEDQLRISVWGSTEFQYELAVDLEGRVFIPTIGQITIAGQQLSELRDYLKQRLAKSYSGLIKDPPTVFMDVTVTRFKPIQVFVLGEVKNPGGYTFQSNSTIFNVLYGVGGPKTSGSLRDIRIIRDGKTIAHVDLYKLLLKGEDPQTAPILNNDRIFIPPRISEISISGPVRRPAIYELNEKDSFVDLIRYAGGLRPQAYGDRVQIERIIPLEERIHPSLAREFIDYSLKDILENKKWVDLRDGDKVRLFSISDINENIVNIEGAVYQPGTYQLSDSLNTIRDLIVAADGLTGEVYLDKADITRIKEDDTQIFFSVDLNEVMGANPGHNIILEERDRIRIYSRTEIESTYNVRIEGFVRNPADIRWKDSLRVYDVLFTGGGLFDPKYREQVFMDRADLIRRNEDGRTTRVISFNLKEALEEKGFGLELVQPFDLVRVYPNTVQLIDDKFVVINGEVKNPGTFEFQENMTLEDLLLKARGFKENSYIGEVEITRTIKTEKESEITQNLVFDLVSNPEQKEDFYSVDLFWSILDKAKEIKLNHRDRVYIRPNPRYNDQTTLTLRGEVRFPGEYTILNENESLADIIMRAGGLTEEAYPKGARLSRNNNQVVIELDEVLKGNKRADVFIRNGDDLFIPKDPNTVLVTGNVALDGYIKHLPGKRLTYYLDRAGGMQKNSYKYVLLTQGNGAVFQVKRKGLFKKNPKVDDGAAIRVIYEPPKPDKESNVREIFMETLSLVTTALTVAILARSL